MTEGLIYLRHHVQRVKYWDWPELSSEEAAEHFVSTLNRYATRYPETPEFYQAVAKLIEIYRNNELLNVEVLDDSSPNYLLDPICSACKPWERPGKTCFKKTHF